MDNETIIQLGDELFDALRGQYTISPLTDRYPDITIDDAYLISLRLLARRQEQGENIIGKKIGVTSKAVQDMLGVYQPDFGFLTDTMEVANGSVINVAKEMIQPRAEAEIAFILKKPLKGPGVTENDVLEATASIAPCFEIVDSRIKDWQINIQDTIADNASCGLFVLGDARSEVAGHDLKKLTISVTKNDKFLCRGEGSAVQGDPLTAVAWVANTLGEYGIAFDSGDIILSGSLVPLEPINAGDVFSLELSSVGSASISFS